MRIRRPGKIQDHLWFLGQEESCIYLLEGRDSSMIISGGFSFIVPEVLRQLDEFNIDEGKINKLLILHSHFDHVGIVPFFKRRLPDLSLYASGPAWMALGNPKAVDTINRLSRSVIKGLGRHRDCSEYDLEWQGDFAGLVVSEGDVIDLGGVEVRIYAIPGHSACSLAAYVPRFRALFPSDGGGIPFQEVIVTFGTSNYTQFQRSLEKLKDLEVHYLCSDHYGYVAGQEAKGFIRKVIEVAREKRNLIEETYQSTGEIEATVEALVAVYQYENSDRLVPVEVFKGVYRQMVKHIAGAI